MVFPPLSVLLPCLAEQSWRAGQQQCPTGLHCHVRLELAKPFSQALANSPQRQLPTDSSQEAAHSPRPSTLRHWELRSHLGYLRFNMRCQNQAMLPGVANCKALMLNTSTGEQCLALEMTSEKKKAMADTVLQPHSSSALA